jgi:hypothetical protein
VVLLTVSLAGYRAVQSLESASGTSAQLTITPQIAAAGEWLEENNEGGNIIVSPHANQVPSAAPDKWVVNGYPARYETTNLRASFE